MTCVNFTTTGTPTLPAVLVKRTLTVLPASISKYVTYLPVSEGRLLTLLTSVVKLNRVVPSDFSTSTLKPAVLADIANSSFNLRFLKEVGTVRAAETKVWPVAVADREKPVGTTGSSGEPVASREAVRPVAAQSRVSVDAVGLVTTLISPVPEPVVPVEGIVRTVGVNVENAMVISLRS